MISIAAQLVCTGVDTADDGGYHRDMLTVPVALACAAADGRLWCTSATLVPRTASEAVRMIRSAGRAGDDGLLRSAMRRPAACGDRCFPVGAISHWAAARIAEALNPARVADGHVLLDPWMAGSWTLAGDRNLVDDSNGGGEDRVSVAPAGAAPPSGPSPSSSSVPANSAAGVALREPGTVTVYHQNSVLDSIILHATLAASFGCGWLSWLRHVSIDDNRADAERLTIKDLSPSAEPTSDVQRSPARVAEPVHALPYLISSEPSQWLVRRGSESDDDEDRSRRDALVLLHHVLDRDGRVDAALPRHE